MKKSGILMLLLLVLGHFACVGPANINLAPFQVDVLTINASANANEGRPVAIDIVFAHDRETLKELEGFTADGWFSVKNLEVDLGRWDEKAVWKEMEISPGEKLTVTEFPEGYQQAVGLVIFANYNHPGLHRLVVINNRKIELNLEPLGITSPQGKSYLLTSPPQPAQTTRQM